MTNANSRTDKVTNMTNGVIINKWIRIQWFRHMLNPAFGKLHCLISPGIRLTSYLIYSAKKKVTSLFQETVFKDNFIKSK